MTFEERKKELLAKMQQNAVEADKKLEIKEDDGKIIVTKVEEINPA